MINRNELYQHWLEEESIAHIKGWDFSHIEGKYEEGTDLPWDYRGLILQHLTPESRVLDIDTGGGEFLLGLGHPCRLLAATEAFPPNVQLCKDTLLPLGVDFREADGSGVLPWPDASFDMVINRHGDFNPAEISRVLKPGGVFITQQVGAENDRALVELLLPGTPTPFPEQYLSVAREKFEQAGFTVTEAQEAYRPIRFYDVGALVWFARIIEWEFPGFSVDGCRARLLAAQEMLEQVGVIEGMTHRFMMVAKKNAPLADRSAR